MPTTFRPYQPDQGLLLAPDMRDWLAEGHLAHHVSDLVDGLDLTAFYAPYEGDGRRKSPAADDGEGDDLRVRDGGVFLPRAGAEAGGGRGISGVRGIFRAIGRFASFAAVIWRISRREVVRLARETGVANFGKLSIDGTKVRANASKRKAMSYGRMLEEERRLESEIEALLSRARETDAAEDARFGEAHRGDELPEELRRREDRLAAFEPARSATGRAGGHTSGNTATPDTGQLHGSRKPDHEDLRRVFSSATTAGIVEVSFERARW